MVREQHERVGVPLGFVYTTTARVIDRLRAKKLVARVDETKAGILRAFIARELRDQQLRAQLARRSDVTAWLTSREQGRGQSSRWLKIS